MNGIVSNKETGHNRPFCSFTARYLAAGWTPCIGTTLGAILTLGMSQQSAFQAMLLSTGYALGLGLPFLALGSGIDRAMRFTVRFRRYVRWIEIASGVLGWRLA